MGFELSCEDLSLQFANSLNHWTSSPLVTLLSVVCLIPGPLSAQTTRIAECFARKASSLQPIIEDHQLHAQKSASHPISLFAEKQRVLQVAGAGVEAEAGAAAVV